MYRVFLFYDLRQSTQKQFKFGSNSRKKIIANFEGGKITSDAGILWMAELDKKLNITARFSQCFQDYRNPSYRNYSVHQ